MTRTEEVYDLLRAELLNGLLAPGLKLKLIELSDRCGVSQSVVREALTRLAEQSLLVATPQRGFRVRELSIGDISDLTETRVQATVQYSISSPRLTEGRHRQIKVL